MVAEHIAISDAFIGSVAISSISPIIIFSSYDDLAIRPITKEYGIKVGPRTLQYDLSSINLTESWALIGRYQGSYFDPYIKYNSHFINYFIEKICIFKINNESIIF